MFEKEAEEYTNKLLEDWELYDPEALQEAYIVGAKAHATQWHDLRKDPNDLPEESGCVLCFLRAKVGGLYWYDVCRYVSEYKEWRNCADVIAWSEIPKFEE